MRWASFPDERGTVTAELAILIPGLLLIVGLVIGAVRWSLDAITATSVTAETARAIAHGELAESRLGVARSALPRADWSSSDGGTEVCVSAVLPPPVPLTGPVTISQCASR